jgi:hypothetical protein
MFERTGCCVVGASEEEEKKSVVTETYRRLMVIGSKLMEAVGPDRSHQES